MTEYWKTEATREDLVIALSKMQKEVKSLYEENCKLKEAIQHNEKVIAEERMRAIASRREGEAEAYKWFIKFYFTEHLTEGN